MNLKLATKSENERARHPHLTQQRSEYQLNPAFLFSDMAGLHARLEMYVGSVWSAVFLGAQYIGKKETERDVAEGRKPKRVRWVLDPNAKHCEESEHGYGCPDLAGEYDSWDDMPTVPAARTTCMGRCACHIEVEPPTGWEQV